MTNIERHFADAFSHWDITVPPDAVAARSRGKIVQAGWAIWYLFGSDKRGDYLDYYASHRMTDDSHVRVYEDGAVEYLPTIQSGRFLSEDPEEDARLEAEYRARNEEAARLLEEKGFGLTGEEPGGVQMNRYLRLGKWDV
jgi:hypothetical protein